MADGVRASDELTIVIPAKNEARLIPHLLVSLAQQDYPAMKITKVVVADAASTDGTPEIVLGFRDRLNVQVVPGGYPSTGRNAGARLAFSEYLLFIDADIELPDRTLVRRALELMRRKRLHCVTANIRCRGGRLADRLLYAANNLAQHLSRLARPFSTGMFMLFDRQRFEELGGFNEKVLYAEDYLLSMQVDRRKFGIVSGCIYTSNRRFRKMGHLRLARLFLRTALNTRNPEYFLRDHKYWQR
ncbi:MAG TPA: glycosyltransferase [Terriglobales bacterium]|nr:glycosyltransferase [Terriglobales bacterium]